MQLFSVLKDAPEELPVSVQLFSVQKYAPPPEYAELPLSVQLFSVPPYTPPPAELSSPRPCGRKPLVTVKPERLAPVVKYTQRFKLPPSIAVDCGPLTPRSVSGL